MKRRNSNYQNEPDSIESTPKEVSQEQGDTINHIKVCFRKHFDKDNFSKLQQVLDYIGEKLYVPLYEEYNASLMISIRKSARPEDFSFQYFQLQGKCYSFYFIKQIGNFLTVQMESRNERAEKNFLSLTKILLHHSLTSRSDTVNLALVELEQLCLNRNLTMQSLYHTYSAKYLKVIIKAILQKLLSSVNEDDQPTDADTSTKTSSSTNSSISRNNIVISYMSKAFEVFNMNEISKNDIAQSLIISTNLIHKGVYNNVMKKFLDHLAAFQSMDLSTLLRTHIHTIIANLILRRKLCQFSMIGCLEKLCSFCDKKPRDILGDRVASIKGRLMLHYAIDPKIVTEGMLFLSKYEPEQPFEEELDDPTTFIEYLRPSLIGILLGIDEHFAVTQNELGSYESVMQVKSLGKFLHLLTTEHVEVIRVKLLSTLASLVKLRPSLSNPSLDISILNLWAIFVNKLTDTMKSELAINICVTLYDMIEGFPNEVAAIYNDLLLNNNASSLQETLRSLFFIPDIPQLKQIYDLITPEVSRNNTMPSLKELEQNIIDTEPLLKAENQKSRFLGIKKIRDLLDTNQNLLMSNVLTHLEEPVHPIISRIIGTLLVLCCHMDKKSSTVLAECLGIIGAINPVRFEPHVFGTIGKETMFFADLNDHNFILELVETLKSCLFSDKSSESEMSSYALQTVLTNFPINSQESKVKGRLSAEGLRACELCQKTSYSGFKRIKPDLSSTTYERLIADNEFSYREWIDKFSLNLFSIIKNRKVQDTLHACSYVFRYNLQLAEFLLPHAIIHIIMNQPPHIVLIKKEILAIIEKDIGISTQDLEYLRDDEHGEDNIQTLSIQCANIVFRTLDLVHKIDCDTRSSKPSIKLNSYQKDALREFAVSLPKDKLALLAAKCRSHVRALYYFDQYLFRQKSDLNKYATDLQRIYVALDDTFDAAGIEMVRTTPMTIIDDVSNYEAIGRFDKAFTCCLTALNSVTQSTDMDALIDDSLKCLSNQGDHQRLYDRTRRLMDEKVPKRIIMPYAIEAAWKLSKWDHLDGYLATMTASDNRSEFPSVGQGQLLSCLNNSRNKVNSTLQTIRHNFIKPLSIAMIDQSAYFRGYENLLTLHSLGDFGLCSRVLDDIKIDSQQVDENSVDFFRIRLDKALDVLFETWNKRNKLVQPSILSLEHIIQWQRSMCSAMSKKYNFLKDKIDIHIGKLWLQSANVAREARSFERSFDCLTQARHQFGSEFDSLSLELRLKYHIERAKLDWDQGEQTKAIRGLKHTLNEFKNHRLYIHLNDKTRINSKEIFPELNNLNDCQVCSQFEQTDRESFSQLEMLLTQYSEESAAAIPETLFFMYEKCVHLGVDREETYFRLARYYDKLVTYYMENPSLCGNQADTNHATQIFSQQPGSASSEEIYINLMEHSILAFGNSLKYGAKHLRESMPRMLNIWYDLGMHKIQDSDRTKKQKDIRSSVAIRSTLDNTTKFISELKNNHIPPYYFMSAISIILSSVCHPIAIVAKTTCEIIEQLLNHYPHQITWLLLALFNDKDNIDRHRAANTMLGLTNKGRAGKTQSHSVTKIIRDTMEFSKLICSLCVDFSPKDPNNRHDASRRRLVGNISINDICPIAKKFKFVDTQVLAPIQATINAIIPMDVASGKNPDHHVIFPEHNMCYVRAFDDSVRIFNSLQQPKQVILKCDNGRNVSIICKSGDDLRKDSRCIEFLNLLNIILRRDSQSNLRYMDIQTFLVLPLKSDLGIIEMVPDCDSFRSIIEPLYRERRSNFVIHDQMPKNERGRPQPPDELLHLFETVCLPKTSPPVLPTWFLRRFNEPTSWYMARLAFTRSAAVASMGGYIIGLGDRHLDNILIERNTGKIVHVDFNLLFHQGEQLNVPERVPFRLTQNVIAAFGPMGTEGNFRKVCEIAMRVMRKEKDAMLTTLKPFMHDPCIEWMKSKNKLDDISSSPAKSRIEVTERKLKGFPRSMHFKPLTMIDSYSVEAQVDNLISEAADNANLAQMYHGWCPHI